MLIKYKATGHKTNVNDKTGARLVASGIAVCMDPPKAKEVEPVKPKRKYTRRDMTPKTSEGYETREDRGEEE